MSQLPLFAQARDAVRLAPEAAHLPEAIRAAARRVAPHNDHLDEIAPGCPIALLSLGGTRRMTLWLTDRQRTERPAVTDEVRSALWFVDRVFWGVLPRIHDDLDAALARHYPALRAPGPWLTLASRVGSDRDGNPSVTAAVTAETLRLHRGLAVERHRRALADLARRLSMSDRRVPPPAALAAWLAGRRPLPPRVAYVASRYAGEPYRLAVSLLAADLEAASAEDMTARLLEETSHRARVRVGEVTAPHLRNPYVDPLNYVQVEMLRRLRALPDADGGEGERLREVIALTINGIAAGLRNTG